MQPWPKAFWRRKWFIHFHVTAHHWGKSGGGGGRQKQDRNLEAGVDAEAMIGAVHWLAPHDLCCLPFMEPRMASPEVCLLTICWASSIYHWLRKCPIVLSAYSLIFWSPFLYWGSRPLDDSSLRQVVIKLVNTVLQSGQTWLTLECVLLSAFLIYTSFFHTEAGKSSASFGLE